MNLDEGASYADDAKKQSSASIATADQAGGTNSDRKAEDFPNTGCGDINTEDGADWSSGQNCNDRGGEGPTNDSRFMQVGTTCKTQSKIGAGSTDENAAYRLSIHADSGAGSLQRADEYQLIW